MSCQHATFTGSATCSGFRLSSNVAYSVKCVNDAGRMSSRIANGRTEIKYTFVDA